MPQSTGSPAARFRRLPLVAATATLVAACAVILSLLPEWVLFRQRLAFSVFDMEDHAVLRPFDHTTHDRMRLRSWYVPPQDGKPVLVYFSGRDGDLLRKPGHLLELTGDGYGVLLAGYRGYGGNPGIPREFDLYLDAISMLAQFAGRVRAPGGFVLYGYSMGTGIAANTAAQLDVRAVILEAPMSNFLQAVRQQAGNVPAILVRSRFDNLSRIAEIQAPILLLAGGQDPVTPSLFAGALAEANPALARAQASAPVVVAADPAECSFQFDPVGRNPFDTTSCDIAKTYLASAGVSYDNERTPGAVAQIRIGDVALTAPDPAQVSGPARADAVAAFRAEVRAALDAAGYPAAADPDEIDRPLVVAILFVLVLLVTAVYGPIAALLVELFPTRIRYTSMSLPYHIGNGWFGGFLPTTAFAMVAATGNIYFGLWYPIGIAALTVIIGLMFLPETFRRNIDR